MLLYGQILHTHMSQIILSVGDFSGRFFFLAFINKSIIKSVENPKFYEFLFQSNDIKAHVKFDEMSLLQKRAAAAKYTKNRRKTDNQFKAI